MRLLTTLGNYTLADCLGFPKKRKRKSKIKSSVEFIIELFMFCQCSFFKHLDKHNLNPKYFEDFKNVGDEEEFFSWKSRKSWFWVLIKLSTLEILNNKLIDR